MQDKESNYPVDQPHSWYEIAKELIGTLSSGEIFRVEPYFALIAAPELPISQVAYLHVSECSTSYVADLRTQLTLGRRLDFVIRRYNPEHQKWEVSLRAVENITDVLGSLQFGVITIGKVVSIGAVGATIDFGRYQGRLPPSETEFLRDLDLLRLNNEIRARILRLDTLRPGVLVTCSALTDFDAGATVDATIHSLEVDAKEDRVVWLLRTISKDGSVVFSKLWKTFDPLSRFRPGEQVELSIIRRSKRNYFYWAEVVGPPCLVNQFRQLPVHGSVCEATVQVVQNFAVFCTVADGRDDMIHRTQIVADSLPELRSYVRPGDTFEVRVRPPIGKESDYGLDFIRLLRSLPDTSGSRSTLFDLDIVRREGAVGGFARSPRFKNDVLATFDHICVICGRSQRISSNHSAAGAAHIVPRSERGTDAAHNGLCLCKVHHWAFDKGFITLSDTRCVMVCRAITNQPSALGIELVSLHEKTVFWPHTHPYPSAALAWHRRNVFLDVDRLEEDA